MINDILDVMEFIVDYLYRLSDKLLDFAINLFYGIAFLLIVLTVPIWILPFMILKPRIDSDDEPSGE